MRRRSGTAIFVIGLIVLCLSGRGLAAVGYLGPAGTYTEEAAVKFYGENEQVMPVNTVPEMLQRLKADQFEAAVVPVENTIGGPVYPYLDAVIGEPGLALIGEVDVPISQTLLVVPGTSLKDIRTVMSHPQGIAQSAGWLKAHLPDAKPVEVSSTAEAARRVASESIFLSSRSWGVTGTVWRRPSRAWATSRCLSWGCLMRSDGAAIHGSARRVPLNEPLVFLEGVDSHACTNSFALRDNDPPREQSECPAS